MKPETQEAVDRAVRNSKRRKELIYIAAQIAPPVSANNQYDTHTPATVVYWASKILDEIDKKLEIDKKKSDK